MTSPDPSLARRIARTILAISCLGSLAMIGMSFFDPPQAIRLSEQTPFVEARHDGPVEELYRLMVRAEDTSGPCPVVDGIAVIDTEPLEDEFWGCLRVVNSSLDPGVWRIDLGAITAEHVTFWVARGADERPVLTNRAFTGIRDRETMGRRLASEPIPIAAGEAIEIWALFHVGPHVWTDAPALRPELQFDRQVTDRSHLFGGLLGASALLIVFFVTFAGLLQSRPARRYAIYFTFAALSMAAGEGYIAALLPINTLNLIGFVTFLTLFLLTIFYTRFVASFVTEALPDHALGLVGPRIVRAMLVLVAALALLTLAVVVYMALSLGPEVSGITGTEFQLPIRALIIAARVVGGMLFASAILYALWSAWVLLRHRTDGSRFFALGAAVLALGIGLVARLLSQQGVVAASWLQPMVNTLWLTDALIFAAAIVSQTFGLRRQRDAALTAELAASQEQLRLSETLLLAHQDLDRARASAERHRSRLATTSHDLQQPLTSLRLALQEAEAAPPALRERLGSGLDYLKSVLAETMVEARPTEIGPDHGPAPATEAVPVALLFDNAIRMFADEAAAKGLTLRAARSGLVVDAEPVALIRMLANLTSNAVKYTEAGAVLIGARRRGSAVALEVRDSGAGMTDAEIAEITKSYRRGAQAHQADGEGIGLASVAALARAQGLRLTIRSQPGRGTVMAIEGLRPAT